MRPPWNPTYGLASAAQHRKYVIYEAYRKRLIVKSRPDTEAEKDFMRAQLAQCRNPRRWEREMRAESIARLEMQEEDLRPGAASLRPEETYSVKPQRGRQILMVIHSEVWASARWLFNNLEYSIGFDSLTSWLSKYRGCVRRKLSPDGHVWLHHVEDFKVWRKKSTELQVRQECVKAQIKEIRL